jgi:hypothetical protein
MNIEQIRQKTAFSPNAQPTQKEATRNWLNSIHKDYPIALTLTLKQFIEIKNDKGTYFKRINKDDIRRIAMHFQHKLNKQMFGCRGAKKYRKSLKYLMVIEGERTYKNLHIHMAIGGLPDYVKWNEIDALVRNAKLSVTELNEQHKVDIAGDSGWMGQYLTKELGVQDTDNVLWDLA